MQQLCINSQSLKLTSLQTQLSHATVRPGALAAVLLGMSQPRRASHKPCIPCRACLADAVCCTTLPLRVMHRC